MQKIIPHLWFDKEAKEAVGFYISIFKNSKTKHITTLHDTPSGDADIVSFRLAGQDFMAINAGPLFKFNPSVSFFVTCASKAEVDTLWNALVENGMVFMELGHYPFSKRYGWLQDMYGLSWQIGFMGEHAIEQKITPTLMFTDDRCGTAEEAIRFYTSVFHNASISTIVRYEAGEVSDKKGFVKYASFTLEGQSFATMDSARVHDAPFNEAISFIVECTNQKEIDYYWEKLSAVPAAEQCGWLLEGTALFRHGSIPVQLAYQIVRITNFTA